MSIRNELTEPTYDQCNKNDVVYESETEVGYAVWYPQMGGYVGKAIAITSKHSSDSNAFGIENDCVDVYVWHDGEFPFSEDGRDPYLVHHCVPDQFNVFGKKLKKFNLKSKMVVK